MKITVDNGIMISEPDQRVIAYCNDSLTLDNPDFYKKEQLGKWTGGTPRTISLYERIGANLILPFGCLNDLWRRFPDKDMWQSCIHASEKRQYKSTIKPFDYQERAIVDALRIRNGILVMPCGSGKTQCGLEIIARLGCRALWLTHTQDLLNQSLNRAKNTLDLCGGSYGTITGGRVNIGTHITFATVQTMCKLDMSRYKDEFDVIIIDEVQHCAGTPTRVTQFYKVVTQLSARYKIGLTATPKRADGLEKAMFAIVGGVIHEVPKKDVEANTCPIKVEKIETGYTPEYDEILMGDGTIDYSKLINNVITNQDRFEKVLSIISDFPNVPIMILANRVDYLCRLCDAYKKKTGRKAVCLSGMTTSKLSKEVRKRSLEMLNAGEITAIFATYQLAKEGLDVPSLRYVVLATPEKDETTVIQSVGRVGRKADGKEFGTVIDFIDDFAMYRGWSKKRNGYYKKIGAEY